METGRFDATHSYKMESHRSFYMGFLLTLFAGPLISMIPLFCADPANLAFRAHFLKGVSFALAAGSALTLALVFIIAQACENVRSQLSNTSSDFNDGYYQYRNCNAIYSRLVPLIAVWALAAILVYRRSVALISRLEQGMVGMGVGGETVLVQIVTISNGGPGSYAAVGQQSSVSPQGKNAPEEEGLPVYHATRRVSLETLALQLEIPQLLNVSEGIGGVMTMSFNELKEKYGVTPEEFMKIKAYRKSVS
ncbi:hypothetical protein HDU98_009076 [Podochytrium sp. JEL0797]|nr:hypothetical protein HDU98_009076 [Podochytrium sp. JEL0797]